MKIVSWETSRSLSSVASVIGWVASVKENDREREVGEPYCES